MKKYSLKPLFFGLLMALCCLAACSDDDDKEVTPVFPAKQNLICNANETREFSFTANTNWSLASSAIWCKFQNNDVEEFVMSGTAGAQTVTIKVTDDNQKAGQISIAKLELTMGGQTIVIGEVTRSEIDYELKIYDADGNDITETGVLKVGYDKPVPFSVKANFRFAATNIPGWVELDGGSLVGAVNKEVKGGLKIIEDESREKYPVEASDENVITFSDEEGREFRKFKLEYEGMPPLGMDLKRPTAYPTDWEVSLDGKTFIQKGTNTTLHNRMPFTIKTLKDDIVFVYMEKYPSYGGDMIIENIGEDWMHSTNDYGKVNITIDEHTFNLAWGQRDYRIGYVFAFPRAQYESIGSRNLEDILFTDAGEVEHRYVEGNLLIAFTQKEVKEESNEKGLSVKHKNATDITCSKVTDEEMLATIQNEYSVNDVYSISAYAGEAYAVYPYIDEWTGNTIAVDKGGNTVDLKQEPDGNGLDMYVMITLPKSFSEIYVIFKNANGVNVKALVITPNTEEEQQHFIVTNGTAPVVYSESNAQSLITMHSLKGIYQTSGESIDIEMSPSAIKSFKVYDLDNGDGSTEITDEVKNDCTWGVDDFGGEKVGKIKVYFGEWGSIPDKTLLIVVTCEDDSKYGMVAKR